MIYDFTKFCDSTLNSSVIIKQTIVTNNFTINNNIKYLICKECNKKFHTKQHLNLHINKKNKCNIKTEYKCQKCNRYYNSKYYLKDHENKCIENNNQIENNDPINIIKNAISIIINSNETIDNKIILLNKYKTNMTNDEIKILLNSTTILNNGKISIFYSTII
jgi:RNase P subunit RPR2